MLAVQLIMNAAAQTLPEPSGPFEQEVTELLVATADSSTEAVNRAIQPALRLVRERMGMDIVFVSQFQKGERRFRLVEAAAYPAVVSVGAADPLESSWCQRVVDGRLPELIPDVAALPAGTDAPAADFPIGTHLSTPIVLRDGSLYGTLCCFSFGVQPDIGERDLRGLRYTARLVAQLLEQERVLAGLSRSFQRLDLR